jgi:uncharacterized membrane protein
MKLSLFTHILGFLASLCGPCITNGIGMALFYSGCFGMCDSRHGSVKLIALVFGAIACVFFLIFIVLIDRRVLKEARSLNTHIYKY